MDLLLTLAFVLSLAKYDGTSGNEVLCGLGVRGFVALPRCGNVGVSDRDRRFGGCVARIVSSSVRTLSLCIGVARNALGRNSATGVSCRNGLGNITFRNNATAKCSLALNSNAFVPNFRSKLVNGRVNAAISLGLAFPRGCNGRRLGNGTIIFAIGVGCISASRGEAPRSCCDRLSYRAISRCCSRIGVSTTGGCVLAGVVTRTRIGGCSRGSGRCLLGRRVRCVRGCIRDGCNVDLRSCNATANRAVSRVRRDIVADCIRPAVGRRVIVCDVFSGRGVAIASGRLGRGAGRCITSCGSSDIARGIVGRCCNSCFFRCLIMDRGIASFLCGDTGVSWVVGQRFSPTWGVFLGENIMYDVGSGAT